MKKIILFLIILLPLLSKAQKVEITSVFTIEIEEILFKKTTKAGSGLVASPEGSKFIIIDGTIYSSVKKRMELQLHKLILSTENKDFMALSDVSYEPYSTLDRFIKVKRKAHKKIYFKVDENFNEGMLSYDKKVIGKITRPKNSLRADFSFPS